MKTNTEINTWEIKDNPVYKKGLITARPKMWDKTDYIASVSNVDPTDKEWSDLTNPYVTDDLVKIKIGDTGIIVNGTDLIIAVENALHASREAYNCNSGRRATARY